VIRLLGSIATSKPILTVKDIELWINLRENCRCEGCVRRQTRASVEQGGCGHGRQPVREISRRDRRGERDRRGGGAPHGGLGGAPAADRPARTGWNGFAAELARRRWWPTSSIPRRPGHRIGGFGAAGCIDGLVNAAGLTTRADFRTATMQVWDRLFAVNPRAPFFLMGEAIADMTARRAGAPSSTSCP
jgi:hypothetical protein